MRKFRVVYTDRIGDRERRFERVVEARDENSARADVMRRSSTGWWRLVSVESV